MAYNEAVCVLMSKGHDSATGIIKDPTGNDDDDYYNSNSSDLQTDGRPKVYKRT